MTSLLTASNITKQFPGTLALDNVQLDLQAGEIHAVIGENGAGKSTLMKILAGVISADSGQIHLNGEPINPTTPGEALALGIATVHQELSLIPTLTVAENIFPGRLPTNRFGMVRYGELFKRAQSILSKLNVAVDPRASVEKLSIANQQLVEIAKAISSDCKILILDEPTSALTDHEADQLLAFLKRLAQDGVSIVYISHKLKEIFMTANRVTILRDGKFVGTHQVSEIKPDDVIRMMVGRELGNIYPDKGKETGVTLLEVQDLRLPETRVSNSFHLLEGEILGFAGLIGSGRSELAHALFGAAPKLSGTIRLHGQEVHIHSPKQAIKLGIGYLTEDRKQAGLFLEMSLKQNVSATVLNKVSQAGFVKPERERQLAREYVQRLSVSTSSIEQEVRRLSGGNQQKILLSKWLAIQPRILIVDEPTRGIDVGAKKEIHHLLRSLCEKGVGVIIISSELPEILGMCDRVLVMHEGAIIAEYSGREATEENIIRSASNH
ncbi:MAG: sugar ABC transporter ATP-binding protein [Aggregatilineales bacterium]